MMIWLPAANGVPKPGASTDSFAPVELTGPSSTRVFHGRDDPPERVTLIP